jgi:hypothetical protein
LDLNRGAGLSDRPWDDHQEPAFSGFALHKLPDGACGIDDGGTGGIGCERRQRL